MATVSHAKSKEESTSEAEEGSQKENGPHGFEPASRFDRGEDYGRLSLRFFPITRIIKKPRCLWIDRRDLIKLPLESFVIRVDLH